MVALTYYAHRDKLRDVGRGDDLEELNRQAVRIANEIAAEGGALVAGNICNTWSYDPDEAGGVGRGGPRAVRGAARLGGRGGRRLRDRRDQRLPRRGPDRPRGVPGARPAGHGHLRQRAAVDDLRRLRLRRGVPDPRRPRRDRRRPQLLARPRDDAPAARADPRGGRRRGGGPARPLPDLADGAGLRGADHGRRPARVPDRSSSPSSARASRWRTSRCAPATSAWTTSASAAAAARTTCARWPRPSAATTPASRYSPAIELHPVLGAPTSRTEVMGGWAAGASSVWTGQATTRRQDHDDPRADDAAARGAGSGAGLRPRRGTRADDRAHSSSATYRSSSPRRPR